MDARLRKHLASTITNLRCDTGDEALELFDSYRPTSIVQPFHKGFVLADNCFGRGTCNSRAAADLATTCAAEAKVIAASANAAAELASSSNTIASTYALRGAEFTGPIARAF